MTLILENGTGVANANSIVDRLFVTAYLTDRGRQAENTWSTAGDAAQDSACILATDHIENRFRATLRGAKEFLDISQARGTWTPTQQPVATDTVTIGSLVYQFVSSLVGANDVLIGASLSATIDNLVAAVVADATKAGTAFHASTVANADASAQIWHDDTMLVLATAPGTPGNAVAVASSQSANPWLNAATALTGGSDIVRPQPLSFPRSGLFDRDGIRILGVPLRAKWAASEYAVRSRAKALAPDPTVDASGGTITSSAKKVGPIEKRTDFLPGTAGSGAIPPYPAADALMAEFLRPAGVIR